MCQRQAKNEHLSRFGAISKMTVTNVGMGGNAARHFGAASVEAVPTRAF